MIAADAPLHALHWQTCTSRGPCRGSADKHKMPLYRLNADLAGQRQCTEPVMTRANAAQSFAISPPVLRTLRTPPICRYLPVNNPGCRSSRHMRCCAAMGRFSRAPEALSE